METLLLSSVSALWLASDASGHNGTQKIWTRDLSEPCSVRHEPSLSLTQRFTKQLVPWGADVPPYSKGPRVSSYSAGSSTLGSASCRVALRPPLPWVLIILIIIIIISSSSMIMIIILEIAHMFGWAGPNPAKSLLAQGGLNRPETCYYTTASEFGRAWKGNWKSNWSASPIIVAGSYPQHSAQHKGPSNPLIFKLHLQWHLYFEDVHMQQLLPGRTTNRVSQPPCGQWLLETPLRGLGLNGIRIVSKKKQSCQHGGCSAPERNLETSGREHFAANVWNWFILIVPKCSNAQVCTSDDRLEYLEIASHRWLHFPSTPERNSCT